VKRVTGISVFYRVRVSANLRAFVVFFLLRMASILSSVWPHIFAIFAQNASSFCAVIQTVQIFSACQGNLRLTSGSPCIGLHGVQRRRHVVELLDVNKE